MKYGATDYEIPAAPPLEALAELDAAAGALDALFARAAELTLHMDEQTGSLRIEFDEGGGARRISPTQLFGLLA